jgi:hypothetical protein
MNPFQYECTCDVCGGTGLGTARTAAAGWLTGSVITHRDPRVCIANLRRQRELAAAAVRQEGT